MTLRVYQTKRQLHRKPWGSQRTPTVSISLKRLCGKSLKWLFSLSEWIQTTGKKGPILNENYHFFKKNIIHGNLLHEDVYVPLLQHENRCLRYLIIHLGRAVQSRVVITQASVSTKFEFRYESLKSKFSWIIFTYNLVTGFSKKSAENYLRKCFW